MSAVEATRSPSFGCAPFGEHMLCWLKKGKRAVIPTKALGICILFFTGMKRGLFLHSQGVNPRRVESGGGLSTLYIGVIALEKLKLGRFRRETPS